MSNSSGNGFTRREFLQLLGLGSAGAALAACGSTGAATRTDLKASRYLSESELPEFPLGAAAKSHKVVTITMWHSMTNANLTTLQNLTDHFNKSQSKVKVKLVNQTSYTDTFTAYRAALGSGNLPDLVQMESILLQEMIDSKSIVPASSALKADKAFNRHDVLASTMAYFTVNGVQYAMPWNCSSQIMYYNEKIFRAAGLDPAKPPTTFAEYRSMAEQCQKKGGAAYGTALKLTSSNVEDWLAQAGKLLLNKENGREGRATAVEFGNSTGKEIFSFFSEMLSSKVAEATLATNFDNLLAIGNGEAAMAIDTSAALGTVLDLLGGGSYHNVTLGVGPLPGIDGPGDGVPYGGAGLYIVKRSSPARQDAAWEFIKFLLTPYAMSTWAIGSGYIPITKSAIATPAMQKAWADTPQYKVAYEQLAKTKATAATSGGVSGAMSQVETDIQNALSLISTGTSPSKALAQAVSTSNQAIRSYNSSI